MDRNSFKLSPHCLRAWDIAELLERLIQWLAEGLWSGFWGHCRGNVGGPRYWRRTAGVGPSGCGPHLHYHPFDRANTGFPNSASYGHESLRPYSVARAAFSVAGLFFIDCEKSHVRSPLPIGTRQISNHPGSHTMILLACYSTNGKEGGAGRRLRKLPGGPQSTGDAPPCKRWNCV